MRPGRARLILERFLRFLLALLIAGNAWEAFVQIHLRPVLGLWCGMATIILVRLVVAEWPPPE